MRAALLLLAALSIGYSADWLPLYVEALSQGKVGIHGTLRNYEEPCEREPRGEMTCRHSYRLPASLLAKSERQGQASVGVGMLISATELYCTNAGSQRVQFGDPQSAARALELQKTYQTVDLSSLGCQGDLRIDAWSPVFYSRSGYVGSRIAIGDSNWVAQLKRTVQFFSAEIYLVLSLVLVLCVSLQRLILRPVLETRTRASVWRVHAASWVAFSVMKSGMLELLFPVVSPTGFFARISNIASLLAHAGPLLSALAFDARLRAGGRRACAWLLRPLFARSPVGSPLFLAFLLIGLSPLYGRALGGIGLLLVPVAFFAGLRTERRELAFFGVALLLECLKLYNFTLAPAGGTTLLFVSGLLLFEFFDDLRQAAELGKILRWWRGLQNAASTLTTGELLRRFSEQFKVGRATLIEPEVGGSCRITILDAGPDGWREDVLFRDAIPPVFSHVLTTKNPLWNVDEESLLVAQLRKGAPGRSSGMGQHFSVLPISREGEVIGAVAFTAFQQEWQRNASHRELSEFGIRLIMPQLAQTLWNGKLLTSDSWYQLCSRVGRELTELGEEVPGKAELTLALTRAAQVIADVLGVNVMLARVHPHSRKLDLKVMGGFSEPVGSEYQFADLYAASGNLQGPMPVAVNQDRMVLVSDISWLRGVLHPKSLELFSQSGCQSVAALPLHFEGVWGVLWLESPKLGFFSARSEAGITVLMNALDSYLGRILVTTRAHDALSGIARADVSEKLLRGQPVREEDHGYLLMVDIRGSTTLANAKGVAAWRQFVDSTVPRVRELAELRGYRLQMVVWDAYFFTKSSELPSTERVWCAFEFAAQVNRCISEALEEAFPGAGGLAAGPRIRACLEYGDISRDLINGAWTIAGVAMAAVHKLEGVCKGIRGWFFFTEAHPNPDPLRFVLTDERHPSSQSLILAAEALDLEETQAA